MSEENKNPDTDRSLSDSIQTQSLPRRNFLKSVALGGAALSGFSGADAGEVRSPEQPRGQPGPKRTDAGERPFNTPYRDKFLEKVAVPIGGLGAGMFCLEGTGAISQVSLRHKMDFFKEPMTFAAISVNGHENGTKVLQGPVRRSKYYEI